MAKVKDGGFLRPDSGISLGGLRINPVPLSKRPSTEPKQSTETAEASPPVDLQSLDIGQLAFDQLRSGKA